MNIKICCSDYDLSVCHYNGRYGKLTRCYAKNKSIQWTNQYLWNNSGDVSHTHWLRGCVLSGCTEDKLELICVTMLAECNETKTQTVISWGLKTAAHMGIMMSHLSGSYLEKTCTLRMFKHRSQCPPPPHILLMCHINTYLKESGKTMENWFMGKNEWLALCFFLFYN